MLEFNEMVIEALDNSPAIIIEVSVDDDGDLYAEAESHDGGFGFFIGGYKTFEEFIDDVINLIREERNLTFQMIGTPESLEIDGGFKLRITNTLAAAD